MPAASKTRPAKTPRKAGLANPGGLSAGEVSEVLSLLRGADSASGAVQRGSTDEGTVRWIAGLAVAP
jgi:hypothetical protein